jgi:hypothetical protein
MSCLAEVSVLDLVLEEPAASLSVALSGPRPGPARLLDRTLVSLGAAHQGQSAPCPPRRSRAFELRHTSSSPRLTQSLVSAKREMLLTMAFPRQPVATHGNGFAYLSRFRGARITGCHGLRPLGSISAPYPAPVESRRYSPLPAMTLPALPAASAICLLGSTPASYAEKVV